MEIGNFNLEKDGTYIIAELSANHGGKIEIANLTMIPNLTQTFNVISGFSDHTLGSTAPITAVALGAKVIEKHFILDKSIGGADADFSMDKNEFLSMTEKKKKSRQFSRSLYVSKDIKKGEVFTEENIRSVRPDYGMHPKYLKDILGKISNKNYKFGERLV